ncbi:hypothetical protein [Rhizobium sp. S163]|uniref:hypothetical protein n=1 Tax=Rhizobium sp. S163 TaxID=3055039 RepID=UPI0025A958BC|nr:hypothetical protein [Rhizobium sp. S163]MDM9649071.1 hypothetical protein [Rhizobium sp. S163]
MMNKLSVITALTVGSVVLASPFQSAAFDVGGSNGISVSGNNGLNVSVGGANGVNATVGGSTGLANASVGGASGVNANVGGTATGGLGVNASVGGASGVNSNTSIGGTRSSGGIGLDTTASIGGTGGVSADVDADVGGSSLATANANVGAGSNTLLDLMLGISSVSDPETGGGSKAGDMSGAARPGAKNSSTTGNRTLSMINDMSPSDRAKAKVRCKDVVRGGGADRSLVSLCKMVLAMK